MCAEEVGHSPLCTHITSAYMVFHAECLAGIELHYAVQLTIQPVRDFENGGHHFPAAKSTLPAINEPLTDVPSSPCCHYFSVVVHVASIITVTSGR